MFVVRKGEEKKNRFITHYQPPALPEIKLEVVKQPIIQTPPKIKEKEKIKPIEKKNIIVQPSIPRNLFCILHNQNQSPIVQQKLVTPHLKKKRFIDEDTGNTIGRWSRDEHKKFIEAIIKFGNNWKEVQEYVNTRTSTQARSHAQKFFEKIKKNNTLKFFDSFDSDYSENFTNSTILQLHNSYGNKSKSEINSVVNKFLSLEYDLPKKRRKLIGNNINGISKKKIIRKNTDINEENDEKYENQEEKEDYKEDNNTNINEKNNENVRNNNYNENPKNILQNNLFIDNGNISNLQEYCSNKLFQKGKISDDISKYSSGLLYDIPTVTGIDYILNQFVNTLSYNAFDLNDHKLKLNKRKNTLESLGGDESEMNLNYFNQGNNYGYIYNANNRKNSVESVKIIQNDKNDFNEIYKNTFGIDEQNHNNGPLDLKNQNFINEDFTVNL
jgi:SHAQKYF class myb-like DNA-binding protein